MRKTPPSGKKLGRDQAISDDELLKRYGALKNFLEWNWGRIGLKLQRVRKGEDVSSAIKLVRGIEFLVPFRDHRASCFVNKGVGPVRFQDVRRAEQLHKDAIEALNDSWSQFQSSCQPFEKAKTNLKIAVQELGLLASSFPLFYSLFAMNFSVQQLGQEFDAVQNALKHARECEEDLRKKRTEKEAWYARNEIVKMKRSKRYTLNADNLAKAMAGMPEYSWLNSLRRCEKLNTDSFREPPYTYQLFELLTEIVRRMKPLKLDKIEKRLRGELLSQPNPILRECVKPHWGDLKRAFANARGKRFTRRDLPYLIVGRLLELMDSSKSLIEVELAKHAEAELTVGTAN